MKTQKFNITVLRDGEQQIFPVEVKIQGISVSVCANIYGREVHFVADEHNGLRPAAAECNLDAELLYQVSRAIRQQRPA
ncbi:hypothetical protein GFS24_09350 [Chitinophaga sp. SYP-B3965]|uniref:hypothetical protein n=1 Tax=Chitinophaga sp. SYP-B3965 TaxID=2663120 RepID=UPI001299A748|nr:hypothetical protein [Chitinophaga sp. SYP-B3965]MRG45321.1 hypothetical protein [Chitinophaga sp. SYP-B3965]